MAASLQGGVSLYVTLLWDVTLITGVRTIQMIRGELKEILIQLHLFQTKPHSWVPGARMWVYFGDRGYHSTHYHLFSCAQAVSQPFFIQKSPSRLHPGITFRKRPRVNHALRQTHSQRVSDGPWSSLFTSRAYRLESLFPGPGAPQGHSRPGPRLQGPTLLLSFALL